MKDQSLKIWGSPLSLATSRQTAFGYKEEEAQAKWDCVPEGIDILLTHGPPKGYLDNDMGCKQLTQLLWKIKPRIHAFGHVHSAWGKAALSFDSAQKEYESQLGVYSTNCEKKSSEVYVPRWKRVESASPQIAMPEAFRMQEGVDDLPPGTVLVNSSFNSGPDGKRPVVLNYLVETGKT